MFVEVTLRSVNMIPGTDENRQSLADLLSWLSKNARSYQTGAIFEPAICGWKSFSIYDCIVASELLEGFKESENLYSNGEIYETYIYYDFFGIQFELLKERRLP